MSDTHAAEDAGILNDAQRAYFESGGTVTDGLTEPSQPAAPVAPVEPAKIVPEPVKTEVKAEVKPEPAKTDPDTGEEIEQSGGKRRMIDFGAYHQVRERFKAAQAELQTEREALAKERETRSRLDERLRLFSEAVAPQPEQPKKEEPAPDPDQDFVGFVKHYLGKLPQLEARLNEVASETADRFNEQRSEATLHSAYTADARAFLTKTPDFGAAYQHLLSSRDRELQMIGVDDPSRRAQMIASEEKDIVARSLQAGISPSERIYNLARERGFVKPEAPKPTNGLDATPAPAAIQQPAPAAVPSVTDEIAKLQAGQAAAKTLSAGGGSAGQQMTVESLANMPQEEFNSWVRKNPRLAKELMGG